MKKTSGTIVFFGNERLATGVTTTAPTLQKLLQAGYTIPAVVAHNDRTLSRKQRELEIATAADKHQIPVLLPHRLRDITDTLRDCQAELGVLVAFGKLIPKDIIKLFPKGIINIHPSLLPLHRGPTPLEQVILQGESQTGVSIMQLSDAMDAGPIYAQRSLSLSGQESKQELADRLLAVGSDMLLAALPGILDGTAESTSQDNAKATYDSLIAKQDGHIDWHKPAQQLNREVRAYAGWPQSYASLGGIDLVVTRAHVVEASGLPGERRIIDKLPVVCCKAQGLAIDRLKPVGKQEMTGEAFLAGYKRFFLQGQH